MEKDKVTLIMRSTVPNTLIEYGSVGDQLHRVIEREVTPTCRWRIERKGEGTPVLYLEVELEVMETRGRGKRAFFGLFSGTSERVKVNKHIFVSEDRLRLDTVGAIHVCGADQ